MKSILSKLAILTFLIASLHSQDYKYILKGILDKNFNGKIEQGEPKIKLIHSFSEADMMNSPVSLPQQYALHHAEQEYGNVLNQEISVLDKNGNVILETSQPNDMNTSKISGAEKCINDYLIDKKIQTDQKFNKYFEITNDFKFWAKDVQKVTGYTTPDNSISIVLYQDKADNWKVRRSFIADSDIEKKVMNWLINDKSPNNEKMRHGLPYGDIKEITKGKYRVEVKLDAHHVDHERWYILDMKKGSLRYIGGCK